MPADAPTPLPLPPSLLAELVASNARGYLASFQVAYARLRIEDSLAWRAEGFPERADNYAREALAVLSWQPESQSQAKP